MSDRSEQLMRELSGLHDRLRAAEQRANRDGVVTDSERATLRRIERLIEQKSEELEAAGIPYIEGSHVEGNEEGVSQSQRLEEEAGNINLAIAQIARHNVAPIVSGMTLAAGQFESWYEREHANGGDAAGFGVGVAQSVLTIVTALFPPARAVETTVNAATAALEVLAVASAAAQEGGQSGEASGAAEARQAAIRVRTAANQLNNAFGDNYAQQLRQDNSHLWSMVGIMILDDNQNDAANTLIREAGIPRPQGNIGRQVLEGMLAEYRRWSRLYAAQHGSIQEAIRYGDRHVEAESNRQAANQAAELLPD